MVESLASYGRTFTHQQLSLSQLVSGQDATGGRVLRDVRFVDCELLGPAVLVPGDGFLISGPTYLDGDWDASFRILDPEFPYPADAISVTSCEFENCTFRDVQFVSRDQFIWQIRRLFHPHSPS